MLSRGKLKKLAQLIKRATADGLFEIKDDIELGKLYTVFPDSIRVKDCYNFIKNVLHEKEFIDVLCPDGDKEPMPIELLEILEDWKRCGKLRRIGAIVNHFKVGLGAGAMVVWQVENERVCDVGRILAGFEEVSHVYERKTDKNWPFNLYTMVHGKSRGEVKNTVERMSRECGVSNYRMLCTKKQFKKTPPIYVNTAES